MLATTNYLATGAVTAVPQTGNGGIERPCKLPDELNVSSCVYECVCVCLVTKICFYLSLTFLAFFFLFVFTFFHFFSFCFALQQLTICLLIMCTHWHTHTHMYTLAHTSAGWQLLPQPTLSVSFINGIDPLFLTCIGRVCVIYEEQIDFDL